MATLLTTRHWESDESFSCFGKTFANEQAKPEESPNNEIPVSDHQSSEDISRKQPTKRKATNVSSKSKAIRAYNNIFLEPSHVKASALLYEITDRTNQLAQPRIRNTEEKIQTSRPNPSQIPKASPRIIELSKPRVPYQYPHKPIGYVAASALMAVATRRVIELSKPKKKRKLKMSSKRKSKLHKEKSRSYVKRGKKKSDHKYSSFHRDRKIRSKKKQLRTSGSDRTIIMVGLKMKDERKARRQS